MTPTPIDAVEGLLSFLLTDGVSCVVPLTAFCDESAIPSGDEPFTVAGYVFKAAGYKQFARRWRRMLSRYRIKAFHTTDLVAGKQAFGEMTIAERTAILNEAVDAILTTMLFGVGVRFFQKEFEAVAPANFAEHFGGFYTISAQMVLKATGNGIRKRKLQSKVAYVFESGHTLQAQANALLGAVSLSEEELAISCYHSHVFVAKGASVGIEAADLLAWAYSKAHTLKDGAKVPEPMRVCIARLLAPTHRYQMYTFDGESLKTMIRDFFALKNPSKVFVGPRKRALRK